MKKPPLLCAGGELPVRLFRRDYATCYALLAENLQKQDERRFLAGKELGSRCVLPTAIR